MTVAPAGPRRCRSPLRHEAAALSRGAKPFRAGVAERHHAGVAIRVVALSREWAAALAEDDETFARRFGIAVEPGWIGFPEVRATFREHPGGGDASAWGSHLIFDGDGALVGLAGWKGAPVDGAAELGYAVAPARQGRGIATAVVRELVDRAARRGVRTVVAHTMAEHSASTRVLDRCGFVRVADVVDPEEGAVWRWELAVDPGSGAAATDDR